MLNSVMQGCCEYLSKNVASNSVEMCFADFNSDILDWDEECVLEVARIARPSAHIFICCSTAALDRVPSIMATKGHLVNWMAWNNKLVLNYKKTKIQPLNNIILPDMSKQELLEKLISENTKHGDIVFDPELMGGETAIACKKLRRDFIGFERIPHNVDRIRNALTYL